MAHVFDGFQFSMDLTSENEKYLLAQGYAKRSGTAAYPDQRKTFIIAPFKRWYWEDTYKSAVHLREQKKQITEITLSVETK